MTTTTTTINTGNPTPCHDNLLLNIQKESGYWSRPHWSLQHSKLRSKWSIRFNLQTKDLLAQLIDRSKMTKFCPDCQTFSVIFIFKHLNINPVSLSRFAKSIRIHLLSTSQKTDGCKNNFSWIFFSSSFFLFSNKQLLLETGRCRSAIS